MSGLRLLGAALGVIIALCGVYATAFEGESSGFVPLAGGIVIVALATGVFDKNKQAKEGSE